MEASNYSKCMTTVMTKVIQSMRCGRGDGGARETGRNEKEKRDARVSFFRMST